MKKIFGAIILISLVIVGAYTVNLSIKASPPSSGAKLYVDPEKVEDPTLSPTSTLWIYIDVYNVTNMVTCQFNISYNPTILGVSQLKALSLQGQYPSAQSKVGDGFVFVSLTYKTPVSLYEQSGQVFAIQFVVLDYGKTVLDLHNSILKDSNGYLIPHEEGDGEVWIIRHDISVISIEPSLFETYPGRIVSINVKVKNEGDMLEPTFSVSLYVDAQLLGTQIVTNLAANETRTIPFSWNTTGAVARAAPYKIKAQASVVPYETNTANNVYSIDFKIKLVGDVNGDGTVDFSDLTLWNAAFGSKSGDTNWNPQADINGDGLVDKEDGILIIEHYKEHF
jgi:hypothetical protein